MKTRHLTTEDLEEAVQISEEYLGTSPQQFLDWYQQNQDLFVGIFDNGRLIGICFGMNFDRQPDTAVLEGIAVLHANWRSGAGSQLIQYFEAQVAKRGKTCITLGSAPDLKTENFYMKNGYVPTQLRVSVPTADLPNNYQHLGYTFSDITQDENEVILYIAVNERNKSFQQKLEADLKADDVIFIFDKRFNQAD